MARQRAGCLGWFLAIVAFIAFAKLLAPGTATYTPQDEATSQAPFMRSVAPSSPQGANSTAPSRTTPRTYYVVATTLNVRAAPSASEAVLLSAPRGTPVIVVSSKDGWFEVKLTDGSTGWMNGSYLSATPPQAVISPAKPQTQPPRRQIDRDAVVRAIIAESLSQYPGNCPCPYNTDRAGRSCGRRSAYSKAGGYSPLCYPNDVSDDMIVDYVARH